MIKKLLEAASDVNVQVNLRTTEENVEKSIYGGNILITVGAYDGSKIEEGKVQTSQFFNLSHANLLESKGGPTAGLSALFEINESYIGATDKDTKGKEYTEKGHNKIHKLAEKIQPKEKWFKIKWYERKGIYYAEGRTKTSSFYFWKYNIVSGDFIK